MSNPLAMGVPLHLPAITLDELTKGAEAEFSANALAAHAVVDEHFDRVLKVQTFELRRVVAAERLDIGEAELSRVLAYIERECLRARMASHVELWQLLDAIAADRAAQLAVVERHADEATLQ